MGSPGLFYFIAFSFGALSALCATFYTDSFFIEQIIFLMGTCIALLSIHYVIKGKENKLQTPYHRSNTDLLIGQKVTVYLAANNESSWYVKINGQEWLVKSIHEQSLMTGQKVVIVGIQGCHLKVDNIH